MVCQCQSGAKVLHKEIQSLQPLSVKNPCPKAGPHHFFIWLTNGDAFLTMVNLALIIFVGVEAAANRVCLYLELHIKLGAFELVNPIPWN